MKRLLLFTSVCLAITAGAADGTIKTDWGSINTPAEKKLSYRRVLEVKKWPANRLLKIPTPFPNIVSGWVGSETNSQPLFWMYNEDASDMRLGLPAGKTGKNPPIHVLTTEKSTEHADGTIVLSALDAKVFGQRAKLETHPGNHRIGFWVDSNDYVHWDFKPKKTGRYLVEIAYSQAGPPGNEVQITFNGNPITIRVNSTGSWYAYTGMRTGQVQLDAGVRYSVDVKCTRQVSGAVMNLKAIVLHSVVK
ncbi:MAG: hypothetical protein ACPGVU_20185 [Limisphaerales bacterium]